MNATNLTKYLKDGKLDKALEELYGAEALDTQRERYIKAPTAQAIWSISPQGLPKNAFSANCAIFAISVFSTLPSL